MSEEGVASLLASRMGYDYSGLVAEEIDRLQQYKPVEMSTKDFTDNVARPQALRYVRLLKYLRASPEEARSIIAGAETLVRMKTMAEIILDEDPEATCDRDLGLFLTQLTPEDFGYNEAGDPVGLSQSTADPSEELELGGGRRSRRLRRKLRRSMRRMKKQRGGSAAWEAIKSLFKNLCGGVVFAGAAVDSGVAALIGRYTPPTLPAPPPRAEGGEGAAPAPAPQITEAQAQEYARNMGAFIMKISGDLAVGGTTVGLFTGNNWLLNYATAIMGYLSVNLPGYLDILGNMASQFMSVGALAVVSSDVLLKLCSILLVALFMKNMKSVIMAPPRGLAMGVSASGQALISRPSGEIRDHFLVFLRSLIQPLEGRLPAGIRGIYGAQVPAPGGPGGAAGPAQGEGAAQGAVGPVVGGPAVAVAQGNIDRALVGAVGNAEAVIARFSLPEVRMPTRAQVTAYLTELNRNMPGYRDSALAKLRRFGAALVTGANFSGVAFSNFSMALGVLSPIAIGRQLGRQMSARPSRERVSPAMGMGARVAAPVAPVAAVVAEVVPPAAVAEVQGVVAALEAAGPQGEVAQQVREAVAQVDAEGAGGVAFGAHLGRIEETNNEGSSNNEGAGGRSSGGLSLAQMAERERQRNPFGFGFGASASSSSAMSEEGREAAFNPYAALGVGASALADPPRPKLPANLRTRSKEEQAQIRRNYANELEAWEVMYGSESFLNPNDRSKTAPRSGKMRASRSSSLARPSLRGPSATGSSGGKKEGEGKLNLNAGGGGRKHRKSTRKNKRSQRKANRKNTRRVVYRRRY